MAEFVIAKKEDITSIANAIRIRTGTSEGITFSEMTSEIMDISSVIEPLEITENGTYIASEGIDGYNPVIVNVAGSGEGGQLEGDFLKYIAYQLDEENKEIIIYGILWSKLYADTKSYDVNIPSSLGAYQVVIASEGVM